jgi:hypothetical protein
MRGAQKEPILVNEHIEKFMKGWNTDDLDMLLDACADDFVYDDPYDGRMTKAEFADFYRVLEDGEYLDSDEVSMEEGDQTTHWTWWAWKPKGATEWTIEGCSLTKAGPDGVHSSRQAYYKGTGFRP